MQWMEMLNRPVWLELLPFDPFQTARYTQVCSKRE